MDSERAGDHRIGLSQDAWKKGRDRTKGIGMRVHIGTAQDVDQLAVRAEAAGISLDADPRDTPWNSRTFEVTDPSGFKEAGTNKATAVTWVVGDKVHDVVQALKVKSKV